MSATLRRLACLCALALLSSCASEDPEPAPAVAPTPTATATPAPPRSSPAPPTPSPEPTPEPDALARAEALAAAGRSSYEDFIRALRADADPSELRDKSRRAKADLHQALDAYNEALDPLRDDEGFLPREHEAHEAVIQQTATYLVDLEKQSKSQ